MTTIFVSAPIANKPFHGGNAWTHLSYVRGFRKLGFDVYFVEKLTPASVNDSGNRAYFRHIAKEFGLENRMALISPELRTLEGVTLGDLSDIAESAELLVNISGHLDIEAITARVRRRAYIDLDPGFTQFWHADGSTAGAGRIVASAGRTARGGSAT